MTNIDIRNKIDENNKKIMELFDPNMFVLDNSINMLQRENIMLQAQCEHKFKDGICIYCDMEEEE